MKRHLKTWLANNKTTGASFHEFKTDEFGTVFGKYDCVSLGVKRRQKGDEWIQLSKVGECFLNEKESGWWKCSHAEDHCFSCCSDLNCEKNEGD